MSMVAGSDSHFADTVGLGVTEIEAEDVDGVLEAIRAGRTKILGRRTPPKFFIGNTVTYIYRAIVRNARGFEEELCFHNDLHYCVLW